MTDAARVAPVSTPTHQDGLCQAVPRFTHAVLDGALLEGIAGRMAAVGLLARSLFLGAGSEIEAAGPFLVNLEWQPESGALVLAEVGEQPAVVFWLCTAGDGALWHHLRTLNHVVLPRTGADLSAGPETVLFRHWDPRVLGKVANELDEDQYARLLGPADELIFLDPVADGGRGLARLARFPELMVSPRGPLSFRAEQVTAIDERMRERSHARIALLLRDHAPEQTAHLDQAGLRAAVAGHVAEAQAMGVQGEQATGLWSCMRFTSRDDISRHPLVWRFLGDPAQGRTPEQRMGALYDLRTRTMRKTG